MDTYTGYPVTNTYETNMIETKGPFKELGPAFGGTAISVEVDELERFYERNHLNFTDPGKRSLLRAMAIPPTFFEDQEKPLQDEIFTAQKTKLRAKAEQLLVLRSDDGLLQYAASPQTKMGWKDPYEPLGIGSDDKWVPMRLDWDRGYVRWTYAPNRLDMESYHSCVHLMIPIFYTKPLTVDLGLFKQVCENGAVDRLNGGTVELKPRDLTPEGLPIIVGAFQQMARDFDPGYSSFAEWMVGELCDPKHARDTVAEVVREVDVPKGLINKVMRHIDMVEAEKQVEEKSPSNIKTLMDLFDVFTFHAQKLSSLPGQSVAEAELFRKFYTAMPDSLKKLNSTAIKARTQKALDQIPTTVGEEGEPAEVEL